MTFGWESLRKVLQEPNINDLVMEHWRELGVHQNEMPLDPDYGLLCDAEDQGFYRVWAARAGNLLVGYIAFWIRPHPHFKSTLTAFDDLYLLTASHRRGMTGYRMIRTAVEALKELDVKRCIIHSKVHTGRVRTLIERMGFIHTDELLSKML